MQSSKSNTNAMIYDGISFLFLGLTIIVILFVAMRLTGPEPSDVPQGAMLPTSISIPTSTFTPEPTRTATSTITPATPIVVAHRDIPIQIGPGPQYPEVVGTLAAGNALGVIGANDSRDWYQVRLPDGTLGWIPLLEPFTSFGGDERLVGIGQAPTAPCLQRQIMSMTQHHAQSGRMCLDPAAMPAAQDTPFTGRHTNRS